jgi:hypothetical protein
MVKACLLLKLENPLVIEKVCELEVSEEQLEQLKELLRRIRV